MQFRYFLGAVALLCVTYRCAAGISETPSNKNTGGAVNVDTKKPMEESKVPVAVSSSGGKATGSQLLNQQGTQPPKSSSDKMVEQVPPESSKAILSKPDEIRTSFDSGDAAKSAKIPNVSKTSNKKDNDVAEQIKPTNDTGDTNQIYKSVLNDNQVTEVPIGADGSFKPARILVMMPMPFYSHTQNYMPIFKELARRGHHMTVVSPYPQNVSLPNWKEIALPNLLDRFMEMMPDKDFSKDTGFFSKIFGLIMFAEASNRMTLQLEPIRNLYNDKTREFDLVMLEAQFLQEAFLAFGHRFKAPVITLYPSYIVPEVAYYSGNPVMTSTYVPNMFFTFSNSMSFIERATNTAFSAMKLLTYNLMTLPKMDSLMREYLPSKDLPYVGDLLFNISFTLMDSHPVLNYPYPRVNNATDFLGINTKPTSNLSEELQEYMDGAEGGVVFFTLGSHYQTSTLRPHILNSLLEAFSRIPNKILMKWDKDEPPVGLPTNVKTGKWFPQSAILAHKNCIGFITHTGVHGLVESLDHAVPVISVPLFADQHFFAKWVVEHEVGRAIDIETVTPEIAYETINEVITNEKYKKNAIGISNLMKDLPQLTLSEITYWVEYVIRTKGARLLRPGTLNLAWYQRFGLDLLAAAVVITLVPLWLVFSLLKCLVSMYRRSKTSMKGPTTDREKSKKAKKRD